MKNLAIAASAALLVSSAVAQNFPIPDNMTSVGTCNVIPFGSSSTTSSFANQCYQSKATVADLGGMVSIITGLGFTPCNSGVAHYDLLEVTMDHHPAGQPLGTTFANNLTASAVTVFSATDFTWNLTADVWNELGLQNLFVYNGTDDIVVQIKMTAGTAPSGFHRDTRQRLYEFSSSLPLSPTGTLGNAALKMELSSLMGKLSSYGESCAGTNGTPAHTLTGSAALGATIDLGVTGGISNQLAFLGFGFYNGIPFPLDLSGQGLPGCFQYIAVDAALAVLLDAAGAGSAPLVVPNNGAFVGVQIFSQYACLDQGANAAGITTTNYGRMYLGN